MWARATHRAVRATARPPRNTTIIGSTQHCICRAASQTNTRALSTGSSGSKGADGRQSWRPGKRRAFDEAEEDEDAEEAAARAAYAQREEQWKAEQAQQRGHGGSQRAHQQQQQQQQSQQQQQQSSQEQDQQSHQRIDFESDDPILSQLHLRPRTRRPRVTGGSGGDGGAAAAAGHSADPSQHAAPSDSQQQLPDLKRQLRAFFMLTHPDFFEAHPNEKKTNAASLALLSDFLDAMRSGGDAAAAQNGGRGGGHKTVKVEFWLRKKPTESEDAAGAATAAAAATSPATGSSSTAAPAPAAAAPAISFYRVGSTLTLAASGSGRGPHGHIMRQQLYTALSSLFKQAGIRHANHWRWGEEYEATGAGSTAAGADAKDSQRAGQSEEGDHFNPFASGPVSDSSFGPGAGGELEAFVRGSRAAAFHYEQVSRPARHHLLLRLANLRLQGVRVVFEGGDGGGALGGGPLAAADGAGAAEGAADADADAFAEEEDAVEVEELDSHAQSLVLDVFERTMRQCAHFRPPKPIFNAPGRAASHHAPVPSPWSPAPGPREGGSSGEEAYEPSQPSTPFSQTVRMPEGFSGMFEQIKRHQLREEQAAPGAGGAAAPPGAGAGAGAGAANATASSSGGAPAGAAAASSFETNRSPFSRVACVFSASRSCAHSHIDGRGRLVFSLRQPPREWASFVDSSARLVDAALQTQRHYRALKQLEKDVAERLGLFDLFSEPSLLEGGPVGALGPSITVSAAAAAKADAQPGVSLLGSSPSPAYHQFLVRLQRDAHQMHDLRTQFPDFKHITLRVFVPPPPSSTTADPGSGAADASSSDPLADFSVDPTMGILLTPLTASVGDIRAAILERGEECVQIRSRHIQDLSAHSACLLRTKRHLKLRSLSQSPSITRDQMDEASERLSRVYGSLRDMLQGTDLRVGDDFECRIEDGTMCIRWNWN